MEKKELLKTLKETLKADPEFKEELLEEIESMENSNIDNEISDWVEKTKTKNF